MLQIRGKDNFFLKTAGLSDINQQLPFIILTSTKNYLPIFIAPYSLKIGMYPGNS